MTHTDRRVLADALQTLQPIDDKLRRRLFGTLNHSLAELFKTGARVKDSDRADMKPFDRALLALGDELRGKDLDNWWRELGFDGRRVQGAKVYDGMIYASGDSHDAGTAPNTNRKYLYKIDPDSGSVITLFNYDEPSRTEAEGLAFGPDGTMHVIVVAPYTTPLPTVTPFGPTLVEL